MLNIDEKRKDQTMTEQRDPRTLYFYEKFKSQQQDTPALQRQMEPEPDCGEDSYQGSGKLAGRKALITGGDSGIGRAAAIAYAREGADVAIQFFPPEEEDALDVVEAVKDSSGKFMLFPCDLREDGAATALIEAVVDELGGLDILVLNAGQQIAQQSISELPIEQVKTTFTVNIISMFEAAQAAVNHLQPGSTIITTSSVQATNPSPQLLDYAATKAAISNFTVNLAQQLAAKGIRVNGVAPGPIWTPLQLDGGQFPDKIPEFGQDSLIGRAGQPVELAPVYVFLASPESSYVTGQIYGVTGGTNINL